MRKSNKYTGVFIYDMKNGDQSIYIQYRDENNKKEKYKIGLKSEGATEQYAFHKRSEINNQIRLGEQPSLKSKKGLAFDDIAMKYFDNLALEGRSEKSRQNEIRRYSRHIKPFIGNRDAKNIDMNILNKFKMEKIKSLAPKTVNNMLELISSIINFANRKLDMKLTNNISNGKVVKFKVDNKRERFLNLEEIDLLLEHTVINTKVDLATRFSLATGARLGTVLSIQAKHIDNLNRTVTLTDHKNRSTYISYLHERYFPDFDFLKGLKANDYVVSDNGTKINSTTIQHPFKKIVDPLFNMGLSSDDRKNRVSFHTLRHSYCSNLAIAGVPIYTIQKLVNHKDISSTMRYSKLTKDSMFDAVKSAFSL